MLIPLPQRIGFWGRAIIEYAATDSAAGNGAMAFTIIGTSGNDAIHITWPPASVPCATRTSAPAMLLDFGHNASLSEEDSLVSCLVDQMRAM
jgi:hypothetical protein